MGDPYAPLAHWIIYSRQGLSYTGSDNFFVDVLWSLGLTGLFCYLWFVYVYLKRGFRIYYHMENLYFKSVCLGSLLSIVRLLINSISGSSNVYVQPGSQLYVFYLLFQKYVLAWISHLSSFKQRGYQWDTPLTSLAANPARILVISPCLPYPSATARMSNIFPHKDPHKALFSYCLFTFARQGNAVWQRGGSKDLWYPYCL